MIIIIIIIVCKLNVSLALSLRSSPSSPIGTTLVGWASKVFNMAQLIKQISYFYFIDYFCDIFSEQKNMNYCYLSLTY